MLAVVLEQPTQNNASFHAGPFRGFVGHSELPRLPVRYMMSFRVTAQAGVKFVGLATRLGTRGQGRQAAVARRQTHVRRVELVTTQVSVNASCLPCSLPALLLPAEKTWAPHTQLQPSISDERQ